MSNLSNASQNHAHTSQGLCARCGLLSQCSRSLANRIAFFLPRTIWEQLARCWKPFRLFQGLILVGMFFSATNVQALSMSGSWDTRVVPQEDVRRFLGVGPTTGQYVDSERTVDLEGEAIELTFWHRRGSWNFTQSWGISYYQMDGSQAGGGETTDIDYSRLTLNATLGYAFDLGFVDVHPQYMIGVGEGNFGYINKSGATQEIDTSNTILVGGPQVLLHFDFSKDYFVGLKVADYGNVGTVNFDDGEGKIEQNRVYMLIFGYRIKRSYSIFSKGRSYRSGIIDSY